MGHYLAVWNDNGTYKYVDWALLTSAKPEPNPKLASVSTPNANLHREQYSVAG